jgi:hypothetical protein
MLYCSASSLRNPSSSRNRAAFTAHPVNNPRAAAWAFNEPDPAIAGRPWFAASATPLCLSNPGIAATAVTPAACFIHALRVSIPVSPSCVDNNHIQHWYA